MPSAVNLPSTRAEAAAIGAKHYFTGKPCRYGNVDIRLTSAGKCWCTDCRSRHSKNVNQWQKDNASSVLPRIKKWRKENPEKSLANSRRRSERFKSGVGHRVEGDPGKRMERNASRRHGVREATPAWADRSEIRAVYIEAGRRRSLGENVHVDHIVPLKGGSVRGLHVAWNLRIVPAEVNLSKGNRPAQVVGLQQALMGERVGQ